MIGRPQMPKVLLTTLTERTSAKGNVYLTGWLAKARVVGFRAEDDEHGNPTWNLYLSEPERRENGQAGTSDRQERPARSASAAAARDQRRQEREHQAAMALQARHAELDDSVPY